MFTVPGAPPSVPLLPPPSSSPPQRFDPFALRELEFHISVYHQPIYHQPIIFEPRVVNHSHYWLHPDDNDDVAVVNNESNPSNICVVNIDTMATPVSSTPSTNPVSKVLKDNNMLKSILEFLFYPKRHMIWLWYQHYDEWCEDRSRDPVFPTIYLIKEENQLNIMSMVSKSWNDIIDKLHSKYGGVMEIHNNIMHYMKPEYYLSSYTRFVPSEPIQLIKHEVDEGFDPCRSHPSDDEHYNEQRIEEFIDMLKKIRPKEIRTNKDGSYVSEGWGIKRLAKNQWQFANDEIKATEAAGVVAQDGSNITIRPSLLFTELSEPNDPELLHDFETCVCPECIKRKLPDNGTDPKTDKYDEDGNDDDAPPPPSIDNDDDDDNDDNYDNHDNDD